MPLSFCRIVSLNKVKLTALAAAAAVIFLAGCGMGGLAPAGNGSGEPQASSGLTGVAHGGRQAITSANVFILAAGDVGYGSAAEILAETTTDPTTGSFSFSPGSYTCPTTTTPYSQTLYLVVAGGNPGVNSGSSTTNNTASVLLAVLGDCSTVISTQPFVGVSEVSTFVGMTALQQFFNPVYNAALSSSTPPLVGSAVSTENFGVATGNMQGLANAASVVSNMVNTATGNSAGTVTLSGVSGISLSVTSEPSKMDAAGNVLAACVNSTGTGTPCSTLFTDLTGSSTITDVLMASYYMAETSNTTGSANITGVCGVASGYAPYGATTCPEDWTLGINYNVASGSNYLVFANPTDIAIDSKGDVWVGNPGKVSGIFELSPTGVPQNYVLQPGSTGGIPSGRTPYWITIDPNDNIYVTTNTGTAGVIAEYDQSTSTATSYTMGPLPQQMVSDGEGNIYAVDIGDDALWELSSSGTASAMSGTLAAAFTSSTVTMDANYNIYVTGGSSYDAFITPYLYSSSGYSIASTDTNSGINSPYGAAFDSGGSLWVPNYTQSSPTVSKYTLNSSTGGISAGANYSGGGLANAQSVAIDGGGNAWIANDFATTGPSEFSPSGTAYSPAGSGPFTSGFVHGTEVHVSVSLIAFSYDMVAVDGSGNVWLGDTTPNGIEEIVGAAVPVVTPIAKGLAPFAGGPNNLGTRPLTSYSFSGLTVTECAAICSGGGTPGVPTITLTEGASNPLSFTTTLVGKVNGTTICTISGTYSNTIGTQITCVGSANALAAGSYTLDGSLTGDGTEYGNSTYVIPFTVQP